MMSSRKFGQLSAGFFVDEDFAGVFAEMGLSSIEAVFNFKAGKDLSKPGLPGYRSRIQIELEKPQTTLFLKRYDRPSITVQLRSWVSHRRRGSMSSFDREPGQELAAAGIGTPRTIAYGQDWRGCFERRSFIITEKIPNAESLERKLPDFFYEPCSTKNIKRKREFIEKSADFVKQFHETGFRHRDLYLAHIFMTDNEEFYLIDLHRAFKPVLFRRRFQIKDISQLFYSAPGEYFSRSDRLRFYLRYTGKNSLSVADKRFIRKIMARAWRMADHDIRHGREVPFAK